MYRFMCPASLAARVCQAAGDILFDRLTPCSDTDCSIDTTGVVTLEVLNQDLSVAREVFLTAEQGLPSQTALACVGRSSSALVSVDNVVFWVDLESGTVQILPLIQYEVRCAGLGTDRPNRSLTVLRRAWSGSLVTPPESTPTLEYRRSTQQQIPALSYRSLSSTERIVYRFHRRVCSDWSFPHSSIVCRICIKRSGSDQSQTSISPIGIATASLTKKTIRERTSPLHCLGAVFLCSYATEQGLPTS